MKPLPKHQFSRWNSGTYTVALSASHPDMYIITDTLTNTFFNVTSTYSTIVKSYPIKPKPSNLDTMLINEKLFKGGYSKATFKAVRTEESLKREQSRKIVKQFENRPKVYGKNSSSKQ
jgi:hypothetical protein